MGTESISNHSQTRTCKKLNGFHIFIVTHADRHNRTLEDVCLFVCMFVCLFVFVCRQHNSKTNGSKVFKLGIGNDLGIF